MLWNSSNGKIIEVGKNSQKDFDVNAAVPVDDVKAAFLCLMKMFKNLIIIDDYKTMAILKMIDVWL